MQIFLPEYIKKCLLIIRSAGFSAYPVGGCVRDLLLGVTPSDYDIASNAPPEQLKALFERTIDTGIKHGTITAIIESHSIEITHFRIDGSYSDNRRPDCVTPTDDIHADLSRRDFTINAMAIDENGDIIDNFDGTGDLNRRTITAVGNPATRFSEDALRIMRAFRFSSQLDFSIEQNTLNAAIEKSQLLKSISSERIFNELCKLLCGKNPSAIEPLISCGALDFIGLSYNKPLSLLNIIPCNKSLRFSALLYLCNADAQEVCTALKCDNHLKKHVGFYLEQLYNPQPIDDITLKRLIAKCGDFEQVSGLLSLQSVLLGIDVLAAEKAMQRIKSEPVFIRQLAVNGNNITALGITQNDISDTLQYLLSLVHQTPTANTKEQLIAAAKEFHKKDVSIYENK